MAKKIVILGCGGYGEQTASHLAKDFPQYNITVINNVDYYYMLPATVRNVVAEDSDAWIDKLTKPLTEKLDPRIKLIVDEVVDVNETRVQLAKNGDVAFNVLVIATGAHWNAPISPQVWGTTTTEGMKDYARIEADELAKAKDVAIVGGGFTGVELAGEISFKYRDELLRGDKTLTLYHAADTFFTTRYGKKMKRSLEKDLLKNGVRIRYNSYVEKTLDGVPVIRATNEQVYADKIYWTTGPKANPPPLSIAGMLNSKEEIKIGDTFQALGCEKGNIFAVGDVSDYPRKAHMLAKEFTPMLASNIDSYLRGRTLTKKAPALKKYVTIAVSAGPETAAGEISFPFFGYLMMPKFLVTRIKARNLWTEQV